MFKTPIGNQVLLITSYQILALRHGPAPVCQWLIDTQPDLFPDKPAAMSFVGRIGIFDDYPYKFGGKIALCFIDECQVARNVDSTYHMAIRGLST